MTGDGFLSRWSRRKRGDAIDESPAPEAEAPRPDPSSEPEPPATAEAAPPDDTLSEEELAALPPIETIDATTDIAAFMRRGVPNALRNAALRKFWAATPLARDYLDPARDYAYDWNVPGGVPGDGPLSPGFDAKALADRLFGERRKELAAAPEDVRETPEPSEQNAQHNGDTSDAPPIETPEAEPEPAAQTQAELDLSAAPVPAPAAETPQENSEFRIRPRRHGRATPV